MISIEKYGAVGDGKTLNTKSFQQAVEKALGTGEAVLVPPGVYLSGTIDLKGASLYLEKGAVIKASPNLQDYPVQDFVHNELGPLRALIVCLAGEDVVLSGEGTIDLNGKSFHDENRPIVPHSLVPFSPAQIAECTYMCDGRPTQSIFFHGVKGLTVKDIQVLDAPCWTFTFTECQQVKVRCLTIKTHLNVPNDDGMHFCSCKGVIVSDCHIESGDDCIAVSGITNWAKPCEDIVISNCVLKSCSKAIVLGYIYSHVRNVTISNVVIKESNRGLCLMANPQCGLVENVRVQNLVIDTRIAAGNWWGNGEPIFVMGIEHDGHIPPEQKPQREVLVNFKNIHFTGISCMGENAIGVVGTGKNIEEMYFTDINFVLKPSHNLPLKGRTLDTAPSHTVVQIPENCGFYSKGGGGLTLHGVRTGNMTQIKE